MPLDREAPSKRSKIAAKGNAALREQGKIHKFSKEQAKAASDKRWQNKRLADQKRALELAEGANNQNDQR